MKIEETINRIVLAANGISDAGIREDIILLVKSLAAEFKHECNCAFSEDRKKPRKHAKTCRKIEDRIVNVYSGGYDEGKRQGFGGGYVKGCDEGYSEGYAKGRDEGCDEGYAKGYEEGCDEGYAKGYAKGYEDGEDD